MLKTTLMLLAVLLGISLPISGQGKYVIGTDTLVGVKGVFVLAEYLRPGFEKYGMTTEAMTTAVELRLRQVGIPVLTREQRLKSPGDPCLYVNINLQKNGTGLAYVCSINIDLQQTVTLHNGNQCTATTWDTGVLLAAGINDISFIKEELQGQLDIFCNAYLTANPKQRVEAPIDKDVQAVTSTEKETAKKEG